MFQYILCIFIYCVQHVRDCAHVHAHVEVRGHCVSFSIILPYALETGSLVNLEACHFGQVSQLVSVSNLSVPAPQCPGYRCVQPYLVFCMGVGKLNFSAHVCTACVFAHNTHPLNYLPNFFALNLFQLLFMCMCVSTCALLFVCRGQKMALQAVVRGPAWALGLYPGPLWEQQGFLTTSPAFLSSFFI